MTSPFKGSASDLTRQQLRAKRYERLGRDVYVLRDRELDLRTRIEAAQLTYPDAIPCHATAALLLKLPVDDDGVLHLARGEKAPRSERSDIKIHRLALAGEDTCDLDGLVVASGPRIYTDLAATFEPESLVALGDAVVRRWGAQEVADAVQRWGRRRGAKLLREATPLLDAGSDSPAETRARLRLHAAGFTGLQHKVTVTDEWGGWLGVPDLADAVAKVALQHEGAIHFAKGEQQRRKDISRDEVVRMAHWQVVTSTAIDDARPELLIDKVTAAYVRAARLWGPHVLPPHMRP